ncbi:MAG: hypothetical protein NTW55_00795 [Planctomycetota bacterium]|nr:hypothetical protein [Planctomycetota bacterium]
MAKKKAAEVKATDNQGQSTGRLTADAHAPKTSQPRAAVQHAGKPSAVVDTLVI